MNSASEKMLERWQTFQEKLSKACAKSRRKQDEIEVVAVSKTFSADDITQAVHVGLKSFGENYVQEAIPKVDLLKSQFPLIRWHFVGHLQSNKAKLVAPRFDLIHSVDRMSLALELEKYASPTRPINILIQINIAHENTKHGVLVSDSEVLVTQISQNCPNLRIQGLMSFPPYQEQAELNRPYFAQTRELAAKLQSLNLPCVDMGILSMGVSSDFDIAVEEGSTLVRVGASLFGDRV